MLKRSLACAAVMFLVLWGTALAEQGVYVGVEAGSTFITDSTATDSVGDTAEISFDPGFLVGLEVGYDFGAARLEGEFSYIEADIDTIEIPGLPEVGVNGDVSSLNFMANIYGDFDTQTVITPYVMGGIGLSKVEVSDGSIMGIPVWTEDDETVFAYQLGVGVGCGVTEGMVFDLKYRYFATEDIEFELLEVENDSHNVSVGLRFYF